MRRIGLLWVVLLVLGQLALARHQIEHKFEPMANHQTPCGVCALADHLGDPPPIPVLAPQGIWSPVEYVFAVLPATAGTRPAEIRARAPPVFLA